MKPSDTILLIVKISVCLAAHIIRLLPKLLLCCSYCIFSPIYQPNKIYLLSLNYETALEYFFIQIQFLGQFTKKLYGIYIQSLPDTMGNLLTVCVHSAGIQDRRGAGCS